MRYISFVAVSLTLRASLLAVWVSVSAHAQTRTLALYAGPARGLDLKTTAVMRAELDRLLAPAGIEVVWKSLASRKSGENFDLVAVGSFEGSCASDEADSTQIARSLADTSIADGHILPFFRIDCTRLVLMLRPQFESAVLGRALARLAGHEIYHIVAQTTKHWEKGLAKGSFSIPDLTVIEFGLDPVSLTRMRNAFSAQSPEIASRKSGESAVFHRK